MDRLSASPLAWTKAVFYRWTSLIAGLGVAVALFIADELDLKWRVVGASDKAVVVVSVMVLVSYLAWRAERKTVIELQKTSPSIESYEVVDIIWDGMVTQYVGVFVRNGGAPGRFHAKFTLHGQLVENSTGPFLGWWRHIRVVNPHDPLPRRLEIDLSRGEGAFLYLVLYPASGRQQAKVAASSETGEEIYPFGMRWEPSYGYAKEIQSCELVLSIYATPALLGPRWERRFHVDLDGVRELTVPKG